MDANEFWEKVNEICTIVLNNKRIPADAKKIFYSDYVLKEPSIVNRYEMQNLNDTNRHLGTIRGSIVLITFANFNKTLDELDSDFDRWMYALNDKDMSSVRIHPIKSIADINKTVGDNEALYQFYIQLRKRNINQDVLYDYLKQILIINEHQNIWYYEVVAEGITQVSITMLHIKNKNDAEILELAGLTTSEWNTLKNQL
jgi:hypothetical protein